MVKKLFSSITEQSPNERKNLIWILISYFFVLFNYPMLRATTSAMYMQAYGGHASPIIWLYSVIALSLIIIVFNKIQQKFGVHFLFHITTIVSIILFVVSLHLFNHGIKWMTGVLYVWKEVYIILQVHLIMGYCNSVLKLEEAKSFFGPLGAMGSIGGIIGGLLASTYVKSLGVDWIIYGGCIGIFINSLAFHFTRKDRELTSKKEKISPLTAIKDKRKYVFYIVLVIGMSQFCVNIMNLKFDLVVSNTILDQSEKASYLAKVFSYIQVITLIIQLFLIPPLFKFKSIIVSQYLAPISYIALTFFGLGIGGNELLFVAGAFITMKSVDYSLFNASKELLYFPLTRIQRYGAKYIGDMVVYRLAKAIIAIVLIKFQSPIHLLILMGLSLILWFFGVFKISTTFSKMEQHNESSS